ncbi:MAG: hypothetical protein IJZ34_10800 [Lachnospiraceae bacterium]|nr:hypothetical protein [Lachnospiraceae bacterium]
MRIEQFLQVVDELDDKYITEAIQYRKRIRSRIRKWLTIAACICLLVGVGIDTIQRYEFFMAGCGANIGQIVDGIYYYHVKGDGIYSYSPEEGNQKELSTYWYQGFDVNEYGIYYKQGRSLFVQEHETGDRRKLYRAGLFDSSHIAFTLQADGNVIVTVYNKYKEYQYELLLDGKTGAVLETVMEKTPYSAGGLYYSRTHFLVGDREVTLVRDEGTDDYDLLENGVSILPEGKRVERYSMEYIGDGLWFYVNDNAQLTGKAQEMFVVRPDGEDEIKVLPFFSMYSGDNEYLFWSDSSSDEMWCFDIEKEESWMLEVEQDLTLYSVRSDGEYVYSCAPWGEKQIRWKLVYDESGRPVAMQLLDENIRE